MLAESENVTTDIIGIGMHERHLQRMDGNPLYRLPVSDYSGEQFIEARQRDNAQLQSFHNDMHSVIQQTIELEPNVESEVILELRGKLDMLYTRCSGFGSKYNEHKENIRKLIDLVMKAVWQSAANDPQARKELEQEEMARQQHFRLLEYPLVADLLLPDTPIESNELAPTLLHVKDEELEAVMWMFEPSQLQQVYDNAEALLKSRMDKGYALEPAWRKLKMMQEHIKS